MRDPATLKRTYLWSAVLVWVAILAAAAVTLQGSPQAGPMLTIFGGGAVWFVVIVPGWMPR